MNNELAGYFLYNEEYKEWEETHAGTPNSVPLYTHPVELTDEEIISCAEMDFVREELTNKTPEYMWIMDFARAILRKAQEKCNGFCGEYECKENKAGCKRKAQKR